MKKLELFIPPPIIAGLIAALMWLVVPGVPSVAQLPLHHLVISFGAMILGMGFAMAGVAIVLLHKSTINPHSPEKTSHLVTGGVYRFTRNPMYVGILLVLAGWAFYLSHILPLLFLPGFLFYMNRFQIIPEEQVLEKRFGTEFTVYRDSVRRWL